MKDWRELIPEGAYYLVSYSGRTGYGQVLRHVDPNDEDKDFMVHARIHTREDPEGIEGKFSVLRIVRLIDDVTFREAARAGFPRRSDLDEPPLLMSPELADFYVECVRRLSTPSSALLDLKKTLTDINLTDAEKGCPGIFVTSCVMCAPWVWRRLKARGVQPADFVALQLGAADEDWVNAFNSVPAVEFEQGVSLVVANMIQALLHGYKAPSALRTVADLMSSISHYLSQELSGIENRVNRLLDTASLLEAIRVPSAGPSGGPDQVN